MSKHGGQHVKKTAFCPSCGEELPEGAKVCPNCGAKVKKSITKKWWFWAILAVVLIGIIGNSGGEETGATATEATKTVSTAPIETVAPTEMPAATPEADTVNTALDQETIKALIEEMILADNFSDYTVTYDEAGYTINISFDGLTLALLLAKQEGYDENYSDWIAAKENMRSMSDSIREFLKAAGVENPILVINVLNDQNKDNTLLSMINGVVVYDVMKD